MNSDLEALLKAYDAFQEASEDDEESKLMAFDAEIDLISSRLGVSAEKLSRLIRLRYPAWIKAQKRPPTMPPAA